MDVELARQAWLDGSRRLEKRPERAAQIDLVIGQLRKRVGQTFTLGELAAAYDGADEWVRELLEDAAPEGPVPSEPGTVADAAFHAYARGATDYRP